MAITIMGEVPKFKQKFFVSSADTLLALQLAVEQENLTMMKRWGKLTHFFKVNFCFDCCFQFLLLLIK